MLSERFFLYLESLLRSADFNDGAPRVRSTSPHVPIQLPTPAAAS